MFVEFKHYFILNSAITTTNLEFYLVFILYYIVYIFPTPVRVVNMLSYQILFGLLNIIFEHFYVLKPIHNGTQRGQ